MSKIGLLPKYRGIVVHDFWESYLDFEFMHGFCNAHLLRELIFQYESLKQDWAWDLGGLLKRMKESVGIVRESKVAMAVFSLGITSLLTDGALFIAGKPAALSQWMNI
jgi:transposase